MQEGSEAPEGSWQFNPNQTDGYVGDAPAGQSRPDSPVSWTAPEFVHHQKAANWYLGCVFAAAMIAGLVYLVTKEFISSIMVLVVVVTLIGFGARKPRSLTFVVDHGGLSIGQKHYPWAQFKSFSVIEEGVSTSIFFMPFKRFLPPISISVDRNIEDKILTELSGILPHEDRAPDALDNLMRKIRF